MVTVLTTVLLLFTAVFLPQQLVASSNKCRNFFSDFRKVHSQNETIPKSDNGFYIYRALTGKGRNIDGSWVFEGISDHTIISRGFFHSNQSYSQYNSEPGAVGSNLRVSGLPVFFNLDEALFWIKGKTFIEAPAIIRVWVNLDLVAGDNKQISLNRNHWDGKEIEQTQEMLLEHISRINLIRGEAYIRSSKSGVFELLLKLLRPSEEIMRPPKSDYFLYRRIKQ